MQLCFSVLVSLAACSLSHYKFACVRLCMRASVCVANAAAICKFFRLHAAATARYKLFEVSVSCPHVCVCMGLCVCVSVCVLCIHALI